MAGLTLDAGALIAYERGGAVIRAWLAEAVDRGTVPVVPSVVVGQVWRGGRQARIARLLKTCKIKSLDHDLARDAGVLLGRAGTIDVVDAVVVVSAARRGDVALTSDPDDIQALADQHGDVTVRQC